MNAGQEPRLTIIKLGCEELYEISIQDHQGMSKTYLE